MIEIKGKYTTANVMIDEIDDTTREQIESFVDDKSFTNPVVIMPDTHAGKGSVIGFTMPMTDSITPCVVGVDIACGMISERYNITDIESLYLPELDKQIRARVPMGFKAHKKPVFNLEREFDWHVLQHDVDVFTEAFNNKFNTKIRPNQMGFSLFKARCHAVNANPYGVQCSIGTLGGGK